MAHTDEAIIKRFSQIFGALIDSDIPLGGATPEALIVLAGTLQLRKRGVTTTNTVLATGIATFDLMQTMEAALSSLQINVNQERETVVPKVVREYIDHTVAAKVEAELGSDLDDRIDERCRAVLELAKETE
jgi:hypothetical protein